MRPLLLVGFHSFEENPQPGNRFIVATFSYYSRKWWRSSLPGTAPRPDGIFKKHRITFETAEQVFFDPHLIVVEDCEVHGEMRYQALGYAGSFLLLVVHVDRSEGDREIIHIISARKANAYEQAAYSNQFA